MLTYPTILAGPVLRRVEPRLVSVWVALSRSFDVQLKVYENATGKGTPAWASERVTPVEVGPKLFVTVVVVRAGVEKEDVPTSEPLIPGTTYFYDVLVGGIGLKDEGLLENSTIEGHPHLCLGYTKGSLPSFSLPPLRIEDLRVLHGSCRRMSIHLEDGMVWLDDLVKQKRGEPNHRPHQLFLSGDQIYADDVGIHVSPLIARHAVDLLGEREQLPLRPEAPTNSSSSGASKKPEKAAKALRKPARYVPANNRNFPAGLRHRLIDSEAFMTTSAKHSHMLSLGEFCVLYLMSWSNTLWDLKADKADKLPGFDAIMSTLELDEGQALEDVFPQWQVLFAFRDAKDKPLLEPAELKEFLAVVFRLHPVERLRVLKREHLEEGVKGHYEHFSENQPKLKTLRPEWPKTVTREGKTEEKKYPAVDKPKLVSRPIQNLSADFLTSEKLKNWSIPPASSGSRQDDEARSFPKKKRLTEVYVYAKTLMGQPEKLKRFSAFIQRLQADFGGLYGGERDGFPDRRFGDVKLFYDGLPKVRRALANIPTYMMFDDHDVTDDWNLNPMWQRRVHGNPLGRSIVRNGLMSYMLFQDWGNDPLSYEKPGSIKGNLRTKISELFEAPEEIPKRFEEVDALLGLNRDLKLEGESEDDAKKVAQWHYRVPGAQHRVLALDNRTQRGFMSDIGPPRNLSPAAMRLQIPDDGLDVGLEVLFVIAPLPVLGPAIFDEILAPAIYRVFDMKGHFGTDKNVHSGMAGTDPDAIEAWSMSPPAFEALLQRLAKFRRVVFLSGDVHYSATQVLSYWSHGDSEPTRFAQFTCSGLRNVMPLQVRLPSELAGLTQALLRAELGTERLGWKAAEPFPLKLKPGTKLNATTASKLSGTPALLVTQAIPAETEVGRKPDWEWRATHVRDTRLAEDRPKETSMLREDLPQDQLFKRDPVAAYSALAAVHAEQLTKALRMSRQILFTSNLGEVGFERDTLEALQARAKCYAKPNGTKQVEVYTEHVVTLVAGDEERPSSRLGGGS